MKKRLVSFALALCMMLTQLPIPAMAEEADTSVDASGEIIAFAPLDETEMSVPTGTVLEDLGLPETLAATVRTAATTDSGTSEEPMQDLGEPEENALPDNSAVATTTSAVEEIEYEQQEVLAPEWEESSVDIPVTWTAEPEYNGDENGEYVFTPVIEGYTVSTDLPEVTVTVGAQPRMMAMGMDILTKSIADSSLYFKANGSEMQYSTDNTSWTSYTGSFTITGSSVSDTMATNTVVVYSGTHDIILSDCFIGAITDEGNTIDSALSPFDIQGGTVNLTLSGSNQLYSANVGIPGLRVAADANLIVTQDSDGILDTRCLKYGYNLQGAGAGIGGGSSYGSEKGDYGNISIKGGEVNAYSHYGAGIGSGRYCSTNKGTVTITGGTVVAKAYYSGIGYGNLATKYPDMKVIITGGSVNTSVNGYALKNGNDESIELYTLTLFGISAPTAITELTLPGSYTYGIHSMKTDASGKLYLYLPSGKAGAVNVATADGTYTGSIVDNAATLLSPPTIGTPPIPGSFTAGSSITLSNLESYKPTITNNGVTITAEGWQSSVDYGNWNTWSAGELPLNTTSTYKLRYYVTYDGDSGPITITSKEVTLNVVGNTTALALAASPTSPQIVGSSITLTATLTGFFADAGVNGYSITFKNGGTTLGTASMNASGVAVFSWTPSSADTYVLTAEYAATAYNTAASSSKINYMVIVDPDIATVAAAKTALVDGTVNVAFGASPADKTVAVQAYVNGLLTGDAEEVTAIVTYNSSTGKYDVALSKGSVNDTTSLSMTVTVAPDPDIAIVAAAKTALVEGTVNVAFGASQADKTVAVQAYVNGLLTGDAEGVTAIVTYNSGTGKYDVALSKGSVNDTTSLSMTVTVAPDPDIAIVAAAKTAAQDAGYGEMTQTAVTDEDAIKSELKNTAETAVSNSDITTTINKVAYTPPIAGTSANSSGTNGSYTFTVTVSKGSQSDTTVQETIVITATPYTGVTDIQAVDAAKTALVDGTVNVAFGASQADKAAAVQAYVNGLLNGDAEGVTSIVTFNSSTGKYDVALSKGSVNDSKSLSMTVNVAPDPDIAIVAAAKNAAQNASYANMTQTAATDEDAIKLVLKNTAETAVSNSDITTTINKVAYTPPIAGTSANSSGTNGSYTFTVKVSKGSQNETTAQKTITITATPYTGGTGGSSGSGSSKPAPSTKPTEPVTGSTENKATVDNKGNVSVSLSDQNITDAIADAKAEAAKKGVNAGDITAVIHVTTGEMDANTVVVNLPKTTQEQVISNNISSVQLAIDRPDITIGINLAAVTEINRQAKADVQLSATRIDNAKLSGDAKAAIGNRPAYDLKALYGSGKTVTNFGNGSVSVEIPYTLQKGEIAGNVYAVYVDVEGKVTYLTDSSYDAKRGTVVFSTSHFSTYGVAYKASFQFTDIDGHWAKDDILFVANRGLMTGTSATTFSPNGSMTRGMFVTALGRLANADISTHKKSSFTDVKVDAYYMGYIEWGVKNNILVGIGGGKFDPDGLVTREQMAAIMDRYATAIGFKLSEIHAQNVFADNAKIGAWAAPSVKRIQMAGIILGKNNNFYDPHGTATRAEVSAVLRRFDLQQHYLRVGEQ